MAFARRNPLAPGAYWIDVFRPFTTLRTDVEAPMREWLAAAGPAVIVHRRETGHIITPGGQTSAFYTFEVVGPVPDFPFKVLGFPNIIKLASAPGGVTARDRQTTSDDTVQQPDPQRPLEFLNELEQKLAPTFERFLPWIAIGVGLYLWSQKRGT